MYLQYWFEFGTAHAYMKYIYKHIMYEAISWKKITTKMVVVMAKPIVPLLVMDFVYLQCLRVVPSSTGSRVESGQSTS
jgi:hypothetical protein